ncbi:MAG TPA: hypothetical protein VIQ77_14470 [Mucilaginibacter sp.]|jgi:hypothetical protein
MKTIVSKILIAGAIIATFSSNLQAGPVRPMATDTGKMSKMDKKMDKKMSKKMAPKKMTKDTGKMKRMSKM